MTENLSIQFEGKIVVITGSTQGLGEDVARLFSRRGAEGLVICGRNTLNGKKVADSIIGQGCPTYFVEADLESVDECKKVISEADSRYGRIDTLVNCAAMTDRGTILDTSPELFDRMFATNARAPFFLMQGALNIMIREGIEGTVVNVQSMSAHGGQSFITAYCGSKGALSVMTKNAAYSVMRHRIRINGLNVGWMDTQGEDSIQKKYHGAAENWLEDAEKKQPFGRLVKTDEVARAIAFLCSKESGLMTGSIVDFDQSVHGCADTSALPPVLG
jgi:NAD(P)-dependent dehydrogenase (short-subunit alcohol dehydrogenase family)